MKTTFVRFAIVVSFLMIAMSVHADYIEIGSGIGVGRNVPMNGHYNYSWSGSIYLASEIGSPVTIQSLGYYVEASTAPSFAFGNQSIYLAHTTDTLFTSNACIDPIAAGYTLVYQGSVSLAPDAWNTIALDTTFDFNGTDNLLVYWLNESVTPSSPYPQFRYTNLTDRVVYGMNNTSLPATGNINYTLPNIRLHYTTTVTDFPHYTDFSAFPPANWDMTGGTCSWAQYNSGTLHCAYANYWGWNDSETVYMTTPAIVLPQNPRLCFYWSHYYSNTHPDDALTVQVSTDEGATWADVWYRSGSSLNSSDGAGYQFPGNMSMLSTVDLSSYYGSTVLIRFYGYCGAGPDLYIDNVCVYSVANAPHSVNASAPAPAATGVAVSGNLQWERAGMATGYSLYFGTDNPPTNIVDGVSQGLNTSYAYSGLSLDTTYYWQVVPFNYYGDAPDCPVWSFTTQAAPGTSDAVYPLHNATNIPMSGALEWTAALAATGYRVYLGTDNPPMNVMNGVDMGNALTCDYTALAPQTTYQWQVVPYNAHGNALDCETWAFTTLNVPSAASCVTPANNSTDRPETGALVWNPANLADGYRVYFGTDNPPTSIANGVDVGELNYYEYYLLDLNTTYYWKVVPYNTAGPASSCPVWNFATTSTSMNSGTSGVYSFANSIAPAAPSRPTYDWKDTSGHTELTLPVDSGNYDDGYWMVTLPFAFPFYGVNKSSLYITTNGLLAFDATTAFNNTVIPDAGTPNNYIAPLWDNFEYDGDAQIFYGGNAVTGFTITYWHLRSYYYNEQYVTMQATLFPDGKIIVCYRMDESNHCPGSSQCYHYGNTIGIENADGTLGIQYRYGFYLYLWTGGPFFSQDNGNLALAFGPDQNNLDWPPESLDAPLNITIDVTGAEAHISWDAVIGACSYNVYSCGTADGTFTLLDVTTSTSYTDASLAAKGFYQVTASTQMPARATPTPAQKP